MNSCYVPPLRYRAKEGLRKIVREILLCMALCGCATFAVHLNLDPPGSSPSDVLVEMAVGGILAGPFLWGIYRIARFALGR